MTHPDPRVREVLERNARSYGTATTAPPAEIADDPAAYLAWLRNTARPVPVRPQQRRTYLDRADIPRVHRPELSEAKRARSAPRPPRERPAGYEAAAAKLGRLPDLGGASIAAAQERLPGASWEELVIDAAAHPVAATPEPSGEDQLERAAAAPSCRTCGTALEPDGACFTCSALTARGAAS